MPVAPRARAQPRARTVLVVDDEENINYLVASALQLAGLDAATAGTGGEALAACTPDLPDVVVLDVMLPDFDGFEVLRRLREAAFGAGAVPHRPPRPRTGCAG